MNAGDRESAIEAVLAVIKLIESQSQPGVKAFQA
jgi:hypothetical protein